MNRYSILLLLTLITTEVFSSHRSFDYEKIAPHPRLLMAAGREEAIKKTIEQNKELQKVHGGILAFCDRTLAVVPVVRVMEGKRMLDVSRTALQRIYYLSYAYRMTGYARYAERAEAEIRAACGFTDWNPSHFLDVGEMVMAIAIGYDWLYDALSEETRQIARKAIVEMGFVPSENDKHAWFYKRANNWNQVCNAGLVFGALAIYEDEPEYAEKIIERCISSNPMALECYAPDGGYPEGYMYWGYGTGFQVLLNSALETALGSDAGLSSLPGFAESGRFMRFMVAPSGDTFCFGDSGRRALCNVMMFWCAKKLNDPSIVWLEREFLRKLPDDFDEHCGAYFAEPRLLPSLLIFSEGIDLNSIVQPAEKVWVSRGENPIYVYRGGWNSNRDSYLGVKGGTADTSHAHMDAGSFIYEYDGIRWSMDMGMQTYITLEAKGVDLWNKDQDGQRWEVFRLSNVAHSTLSVNGERHRVDGFAEMTQTYDSPAKKGADIDLTSTLGKAVKSALRSVTLDKKEHLTVTDKIVNGDEATHLQWVMVTPAEARVTGQRTVELTKDGRRMLMKVSGPGKIEMKTWSNDPPNSYDFKNPGTQRVGFVSDLAPNAKAEFKVTLTPLK